jgi:hypothetical protein
VEHRGQRAWLQPQARERIVSLGNA